MSIASHKLTLMGEQLARATEKIAHAKRPLLSSPVEYDPPVRRSTKDRLAEHLANYEAMRDDELALEMTSLETSMENIRIELRLEQEGESQHERGWRARAEHALSGLRGQANLCRLEIDKRRRYDAEQRKEDKQAEIVRQRVEKQAEMERRGSRRNNVKPPTRYFYAKAKNADWPSSSSTPTRVSCAQEPRLLSVTRKGFYRKRLLRRSGPPWTRKSVTAATRFDGDDQLRNETRWRS
jgi:hypothetical protein